MNDLREIHDGPEMDALRELRADVPQASQAQRAAAWERVQGAHSQGVGARSRSSRAWTLGAVAAVAAAVTAGAVAVPLLSDGGEGADVASSPSTSVPASAAPTPYASGSVWEPVSSEEAAQVEEYRTERVERVDGGGVKVVLEDLESWEALTKALNAEGIPIRVWAVAGEPDGWDVRAGIPIDPERGVDTSVEPTGSGYPKDQIVVERVAGEDSAVRSLTFPTIPTDPVDITIEE